VQMRAAVELGGKSQSQHSQFGFSNSMAPPPNSHRLIIHCQQSIHWRFRCDDY
jgi:hypothetical protein